MQRVAPWWFLESNCRRDVEAWNFSSRQQQTPPYYLSIAIFAYHLAPRVQVGFGIATNPPEQHMAMPENIAGALSATTVYAATKLRAVMCSGEPPRTQRPKRTIGHSQPSKQGSHYQFLPRAYAQCDSVNSVRLTLSSKPGSRASRAARGNLVANADPGSSRVDETNDQAQDQ